MYINKVPILFPIDSPFIYQAFIVLDSGVVFVFQLGFKIEVFVLELTLLLQSISNLCYCWTAIYELILPLEIDIQQNLKITELAIIEF